MNKRGQLGITLLAILILIVVVTVPLASYFGMKGFFSIADEETNLRAEYATYWGNSMDGGLILFDTSGSVNMLDENIKLTAQGNGDSSRLSTKEVFNGEDVVILLSGGTPTDEASCKITPAGSINGGTTKIVYEAHTLDTGYDVIQNGIKTGTFDASDGFKVALSCLVSGGRDTISLDLEYIGHKSRFCDVRPNEVDVKVRSQSPISRSDLDDLNLPIPTQFCHESKPFLLRTPEGIAPLSKYEGIIPFNKGEAIPNRKLEDGESVIIFYATPNTEGVNLKTCEEDESNVYVNGQWECEKDIETSDIPVRETISREIVASTLSNQFRFSSYDKSGFNIGDKAFVVLEQDFNCAYPEEGQTVYVPNPKSVCYSSDISFNGVTYTMTDSTSKQMTDSIKVTYYASGKITGENEDVWGEYIFDINDPIIFTLEGGLNVPLNQKTKIPLTIQNNLPTNEAIIRVQQRVDVIETNLPEREERVMLYNGVNAVDIPIDSSNLGLNTVAVQVFYPLTANSDVLIASDKIIFGVDVNEGESTVEFVDVQPQEQEEQKGFIASIISAIIEFFKNLF